METSELRLGNLVNRKYWNPEPNNEKYCTEVNVVTWISPSNINVSPIISKEKFRITKDDILPIPLTEEWMLKFGFKTDYEQIYFEKNECYIKNNNGCLKWVSADTCITISDNPVKSVHQLQNLYFCITGEELELK